MAAQIRCAACVAWALSMAAMVPWSPPALADAPDRGVAAKADSVIVLKSERRLLLFRDGRELKSYPIALGSNPVGHKLRRNDGRTPEGGYVLDRRNAESRFHRSIRVSYPNAADRTRAQRLGVAPGGNVMVHGQPAEGWITGATRAAWDWTEGCIAVSNADMDEVWDLVDDGTPIKIRP